MSFKSQRRLTAQQFEATLPFLRISPDRIEAARRSMVDGDRTDAVAEHYNWTRNAVSICVRKVWEVAERLRLERENWSAGGVDEILPKGWEKRTFVAPVSLMGRWALELEVFLSGSGLPAPGSSQGAAEDVGHAPKAEKQKTSKPAAKKSPAAKKTVKKK